MSLVPVSCPTRRAACPIVAAGFRYGAQREVGGRDLLVTVGVASAVAGCGSSDSTASKTPGPTAPTVTHGAPVARAGPRRPDRGPGRRSRSVRRQPCRPRDRRARCRSCRVTREAIRAWSPEPLAGNYNECAQLSVVIVKANTNAENPNTRAVMFHLGKFIPTRRAGYLRLQRHRQRGDHRRHRRAAVLQRSFRAGQRGAGSAGTATEWS